MKYPLSVIALWFEREQLNSLENANESIRSLSFSNVYLCLNAKTEFPKQNDCLYVGELKTVRILSEENADSFFITNDNIESVRLENKGHVIVIPGNESIGLYQSAWKAFDDINKWIFKLNEVVENKRRLQELLDISQDIIQNPILIFDAEFKVLASSKRIDGKDIKLYDFVQSGFVPPETVLKMQKIERKTGLPLGDGIFYSETNKVCGIDELFIPLFTNNHLLVARVSVRCSRLKSCDGSRWLLSKFCKSVLALLAQKETSDVFQETKDYLMSQLIDGKIDVEQACRTIGIHTNGEYQILCLGWKSQKDREKIINITPILSFFLPMSHIFIYHDCYYIIWGTNILNHCRKEFWTFYKEKSTLFCKSLGICAGASDVFTNITNLKSFCQQAYVAKEMFRFFQGGQLTFCKSEQQNGFICEYRSISSYHMVLHAVKSMPCETVGHPAFWEMLKDDVRSGTNNHEIILCYLNNECKAEPTAKEFFMHRNSILYRINQLVKKYEIDLSDPQQRFMFIMANIAHESSHISNEIDLIF